MAYGKLIRFAKENETAKIYLEEKMYFEAWITYIHESNKTQDEILNDIEAEINLKRCPLTENEIMSLQIEAYDCLI